MRKSKLNPEEYIGKKFGMLTIREILPRRRKPNGKMEPQKVLTECECGNTTTPTLIAVVSGKISTCGCTRIATLRASLEQKRVATKILEDIGADEDADMCKSALAVKLGATYYCPYPERYCVRSSAAHICCRECDKEAICDMACKNTPYKCEADLLENVNRRTEDDEE